MVFIERHPDYEQSVPPEVVIEDFVSSIRHHQKVSINSSHPVELIAPQEYAHLLSTINSDNFKMRLELEDVSKLKDEPPGNNILICARVLNITENKSPKKINLAALFIRHLAEHKEISDQPSNEKINLAGKQKFIFEDLFKNGVEPEDLREVSNWFLSCR